MKELPIFTKIHLAATLCLTGLACNAVPEDLIPPFQEGATPIENQPAEGTTPQTEPQPRTSSTPAPRPTPTTTATSTPRPTPTTTATPTPTPTATGKPIALVYGGPGVLPGVDDTLEVSKQVAAQAGFKVIVVTQPVSLSTLNSASVWIQPGGPNLSADRFMNGNGMSDQVRDFVQRGGGYVGFCGGAFSAVNNLGLIRGSAWNLSESTRKIPITWLGATRYLHFEHGPYINLTDGNAEVVATYANGKVAAARALYGRGKVFITGPHPEATSTWPPTADPDGSDQYIAVGMIREVAARPQTQ